MYFTMVYCYKSDERGNYDDTNDLVARLIVSGAHDEQSLVGNGHVEELLKDVEGRVLDGFHYVFEAYVLDFKNPPSEDENVLLEMLKSDDGDLIDSGDIEIIDSFDFRAKLV